MLVLRRGCSPCQADVECGLILSIVGLYDLGLLKLLVFSEFSSNCNDGIEGIAAVGFRRVFGRIVVEGILLNCC